MNKSEISAVQNKETGKYRFEIKIGKKLYRSEHIFPSEQLARAIAIHCEKSIKYASGHKEAIADRFVP